MRLMRAYHVRLAETADPDAPLIAHFADYLETLGIDPAEGVPAALIGTLDSRRSSAPATCATASRSTAGWR